MVDWKGLEKDFRDIPDPFSDMRADWSDQPGLRNHWRIAAGIDSFVRGRLEALATQAGRFLLVSSAAIGKCSSDLRAIENDMARWLTAVREITGKFEFGLIGTLLDANETPSGTIYTGSISRVIEASALLCLQLSKEETTTTSSSSTTLYDGVRLRLHPDEIDSFQKIRDILSSNVQSFLDKAGRINLLEDFIQKCLEDILSVPLHKQDWGGEENDLYTANVVYNGKRIPAAFALKGRGQKHKMLEISDCGKNGDQLVRLFQSPADLFVLQYGGEISENVIKDMEGKTDLHRHKAKQGWYCVLNGQDTARLLLAYGKL
jgi:hypothetical protein